MGIVVVACFAAAALGVSSPCDNEVGLQANELGSERRQSLSPPLRVATLEDDVLAFQPAEIPKALSEYRGQGRVTGRGFSEPTYSVGLSGLLGLDGERRDQEHHTSASEEGAAVHYWITSSARASTDGGIVRPMALAVLRLMTKWSRSSCSMGRSPGAVPSRTRSAYLARRWPMMRTFSP